MHRCCPTEAIVTILDSLSVPVDTCKANAVGMSLLLVTGVAHAISAVLLWRGLRPFRASVERNELISRTACTVK